MTNHIACFKRKNFTRHFKAVSLFLAICLSTTHIGMAFELNTKYPKIALTEISQDTTDLSDLLEIEDVPIIIEEEPVEEQVFQVVEVMPRFPGGSKAMNKYLQQNIIYPKECIEEGIEGRVTVQFIVDVDGSVIKPKVVKPINPYLDKEAVRVVSTMPKWIPGNQRGKTLRVQLNVIVTFILPNK